MLVYRAECEQGYGPFGGIGDELYEALEADRGFSHCDSVEEYPNLYNEKWAEIHFGPWEGLCAAASYEQWCHWFTKTCQNVLRREGYFLVIYDVPDEDVLRGRTQVVFKRDRARLVSRHLPDEDPNQIPLPLAA